MSDLIDATEATRGFAYYQREAKKSALKVEDMGHPIVYPTMGLASEAGELAGKIKKIFRDKDGTFSLDDKRAIRDEAGDCLWYLSQILDILDISLQDAAYHNLLKLLNRQLSDTIRGDGDNR